jgi:hypothetical protein
MILENVSWDMRHEEWKCEICKKSYKKFEEVLKCNKSHE